MNEKYKNIQNNIKNKQVSERDIVSRSQKEVDFLKVVKLNTDKLLADAY